MAYLIVRCLLCDKTGFLVSTRFASYKSISQNLEIASSDRSFDNTCVVNVLQFDIYQRTRVSGAASEGAYRCDLATNNLNVHRKNN